MSTAYTRNQESQKAESLSPTLVIRHHFVEETNIFLATTLSSGLCIKDEADHPQALLDPFLLLVDNHHQHGADELRHREGHIDRHHGSGTTSNKAFVKRELEEGVKLPENCFHAA